MKRSCIIFLVSQLLCCTLFASAKDAGAKTGDISHKKFRLSYNVIFSDLVEFDGLHPDRGYHNNLQQPDHELGHDIIISLNNDLRRSRISKSSAVFVDISSLINIITHISFLKNDATLPHQPSSYCFSSTDFHRYIFRLKPF